MYNLVSLLHLFELISSISTNVNVPAAALLQNELFPLCVSNYNTKLVFFVTVLEIDQQKGPHHCFLILIVFVLVTFPLGKTKWVTVCKLAPGTCWELVFRKCCTHLG